MAVLFGGRSLEHDVSVVSGLQVLHALDPDACAPLPIYIDQATSMVDWRRSVAPTRFKERTGPVATDRGDAGSGFGTSALLPVSDFATPDIVGSWTDIVRRWFGHSNSPAPISAEP